MLCRLVFVLSLLTVAAVMSAPSALGEASGNRGYLSLSLPWSKKPVRLYERSHALVIGIDGYTNGWPELRNAIADAEAIGKELRRRGFDVTVEKNLTSRDFGRVIRSFFNGPGADPEARLVIWFAGHGYSLPRRFEKNVYDGYLIPADAPVPPADPVKNFRQTGAFKDRAYAIAQIGLLMKQAAAKHIIAIMDSCFSGTVFDTRAGISKIPPEITKRTIEPVRQLISSGTVGQEVSDNGLFRKLFLDAITGRERAADTNGDGYVTGGELGRFLSFQVAKYSRNAQTPRMGKLIQYGLDRGDFVFRVTGKGTNVAKSNTGSRGTQASGERRSLTSPTPASPGSAGVNTAVVRDGAPLPAKQLFCSTPLRRNLIGPVELYVGKGFCSSNGKQKAMVVSIHNRAVIFSVNGKRFTCLQGELCAFDWPQKPLFRITAQADKARGIKPQATMLPR